MGNTLPATFWAAYFLLSQPEALQAVRQEILDVLQDSGVDFSPDRDVMFSKEQLDKLIYLGRFWLRVVGFWRWSGWITVRLRPQRAPSTRASACPQPP